MEKSVPTWVKVIAVLYYIGAAFGILFGLAFLIGASAISSLATQINVLEFLGAGVFIAIGIFLIIFGALGIFIGRGLWKAHNWARIVAIIFSGLWVLLAIFSIVNGNISGNIINFVLNLAIGLYLLFNKQVKNTFA
jgi:uncharacterized membrane protein